MPAPLTRTLPLALSILFGGSLPAFGTLPAAPQTPAGPARLATASPQDGEAFGLALELCGDTLAVGAPQRNSNKGVVVVYERDTADSELWTQVKQLKPSVTQVNQFFGYAVALSGDTLLVGTTSSDMIFVFERNEGGADNWGETRILFHPTLSAFTEQIMDMDANTALVGGDEFAMFFERNGGPGSTWSVGQTLAPAVPANTNFGKSVAISGDLAAIGAPNDPGAGAGQSGAVHLFERDTGTGLWSEIAVLTQTPSQSQNKFGAVVELRDETVLVRAKNVVYVYERSPGQGAWTQTASFAPSGVTVDGISLSESAALIAGSPHAALFTRTPSGWSTGTEIAISSDSAAIDGSSFALGSPFAQTGPEGIEGLAFDPLTGRHFGSDPDNEQIVTVDPVTGKATPLGPTGLGSAGRVEGLAFDPTNGVLFGTDVIADQLLALDTATGEATPIGPLGFDKVRGLAFDTSTGTLFGCDDTSGQLISIDVATGSGTAVGPTGFASVRALAYDAALDTLFGIDKPTRQFLAIDRASGLATAINPTGFNLVEGLSPKADGALLGTTLTTLLVAESISIDPFTGSGTLIAAYGPIDQAGLAHVFALECAPVTYCTAGVSASGCSASIAGFGTPSASAPDGFELRTSGVEGARPGLFYYGTSGPQATSWGNGTSYQCVTPPVSRTGITAANGTPGLCDGAYSVDLNDLWTLAPQKRPSSGTVVDAQFWYRDPQNTSNQTTSLSDALEFIVCP